jgi:hypothetical protein
MLRFSGNINKTSKPEKMKTWEFLTQFFCVCDTHTNTWKKFSAVLVH